MENNTLTKEEQIIRVLSDSSTSVTNKYLQEKFGVNENYLVSLRNRIKNGNITLNKEENVAKQQ